MSINFECPMCGKHYTASDDHVGRKVKCNNCGEKFCIQVVNDEIQIEIDTGIDLLTLDQPKLAAKKEKNSFLEKLCWNIIEFFRVGLVEFIWSNKARRVTILVIYAGYSLLTYFGEIRGDQTELPTWAAVIIHLFFGWVLFKKFGGWKPIAFAAALIFVQAKTGSYQETWNNWSENGENEDWDYTRRTISRWSEKTQYLYEDHVRKDFSYSIEGPLHETGSRHGKWILSPTGVPDTTAWYWHGEKVSEAEFFRLEADK